MNFRHRLFLLPIFCCLLLTACGPDGDDFVLRGEIEGMEQSELLIYSIDGIDSRIDTIRVNDGRFAYAGHARKVTPYVLLFPNAVEQVIYVAGGATLEYKAKASDLSGYTVSGTKENELLNDFRRETHGTNPLETRSTAERYIRKHSESIAAIYIYDRYFVQDPTVDPSLVSELNDLLSAKQEDNPLLLITAHKLERSRQTAEGEIADVPDSIMSGAQTLIYFWATWQPMAWSTLGKLRDIVRRHTPSQLGVVTVSLDPSDNLWKTYFQSNDSVKMLNLHEPRAWDSPLAESLNITKVPTFILLDKKKRIVKRFYQIEDFGQ